MYLHLYSFFHTILTGAQNTWIAHLSIIPECYSVYLVIFPICTSCEGAFEHPQGANVQSVHPIEIYLLNLLF